MPILSSEQQFGIHAVFHHVWRAPLAGNGDVVAKMPREIVAEVLRPAINLPSAERLEIVMIQRKDSPWTIAAGRAESA